jgi:hypothetical protein
MNETNDAPATKKKATKFTVTVNGKTLQRVSLNKTYAYVIVASGVDGFHDGEERSAGFGEDGFFSCSWHSRLDLAQKELAKRLDEGYQGFVRWENFTLLAVGDNVTIETPIKNELAEKVDGRTISRPSNRRLPGAIVSRVARNVREGGYVDEAYTRISYVLSEKRAMEEVAKMSAQTHYTWDDVAKKCVYDPARPIHEYVKFVKTTEAL